MIRIITIDDVRSLIRKVTIEKFFTLLIEKMRQDFSRWQDFHKTSRSVSCLPNGVIELMPIHDKDYYSVKYINGHPTNPERNKQTIVGLGVLADVATGYPVLISEMTLLTALRTAATSALACEYLAKKGSATMALIGTGAQSEFQALAHKITLDIQQIRYFDLDAAAMEKFATNLAGYSFELVPCHDQYATLEKADIITTATATKQHVQVLQDQWITPGMTINALGGDCHGKTELDPRLLQRSKVVVEFKEQTQIEGEIQNCDSSIIYAELWELVCGKKPGRTIEDDIMIFDSVGFALEDYTILRLVYSLAEDFHVGHMLDMVPVRQDPKNLFGLLNDRLL